MVTVFIVLLFLVIVIFYNHIKNRKFKDIARLPGPTAIELIKGLYYNKPGAVKYLLSLNEKYGPVIKLRIWPFKPAVMTTEVAYIEKVMCSNHLYTPCFQILRPYIRNGIATIESAEQWKKDRKIISKELNKHFVESNWNLYNEKSDLVVKHLQQLLGKPMDLQLFFTKAMLETILESLTDPQINLTSEQIQEYVNYKFEFNDALTESIDSFKFSRFFKGNSVDRAGKKLIRFAEELLKRHLQVDSSQRQKHNLIYGMISGGMPTDRIVDNINTLIQAGHDSSAVVLAFMFYEMTKYPHLQQRIFEEVVSIVGTDRDVPINISDVQKMTYLHIFISETLRLHFFLSIIDRRLDRDITIDNIRIPKGTTVMFPFTVIHTLEKYFKDPLNFDPDRFLSANITPEMQLAFHGFGHGPKICVGLPVAHVLLKMFVAKIIRRYEVHPVQEHQVGIVGELIRKSGTGIPVIFKERII